MKQASLAALLGRRHSIRRLFGRPKGRPAQPGGSEADRRELEEAGGASVRPFARA